MKAAGIQMGAAVELHLEHAILVYRGCELDERSMATIHDVEHRQNKAAVLGPGRLATVAFLNELVRGLSGEVKPEVLPENVLVRTPHVLCWWTRPMQRLMYFRRDSKAATLNGQPFPMPPLVWMVVGNELRVRALMMDRRPDAETKMARAPFWNTDDRGLVCQGDMKRPANGSVESMAGWMDGFFASEFTHQNGGGKLTAHPKGFVDLWRELARKRSFPPEYLQPVDQTLKQFVEGNRA